MTLELTHQQLLSAFRLRDRLQLVKCAAMLAFGLPCVLVPPAVLGSMLWYIVIRWTDSMSVSWWWYFGAAALITLPLLFRLERRTEGGYLDDVVSEGHTPVPLALISFPGMTRHIMAGVAIAANPRMSIVGVIDVFLFGPRLVIGAMRQLCAAGRMRGVDRSRCADIVAALARAGGGVNTQVLLQPGERMEDVLPVLAYLVYHRWIGVHSNGERAWLSTEARRRLGGQVSDDDTFSIVERDA